MTTAKRDNFRPQRPTHVKSTQRVVEQMDYADGESDTCFDLFAHEVVPRYKAKEIEVGYSEDD